MDPVGQSMDGLTLLEIDRDYRLLNRLDARQARWTADGWEFWDGVVREFGIGDQVQALPFRLTPLELPERFEDFTQIQKPTEMMNFLELSAYLARLHESGRARVEIEDHQPSRLAGRSRELRLGGGGEAEGFALEARRGRVLGALQQEREGQAEPERFQMASVSPAPAGRRVGRRASECAGLAGRARSCRTRTSVSISSPLSQTRRHNAVISG